MTRHRYRVVDVFTNEALQGNPLAVFPDASGIPEPAMQRIAQELNLSETTFVLPPTRPDCAAAVRIFTPGRELIFAGHPTIGTAFVLLQEGLVTAVDGRFTLDERVGPVPVRVENGKGRRPLVWLTTPPITAGRTYHRDICARALGLALGELLDVPPQLWSAGAPTIFIALASREAVDRAWLDIAGMRMLDTDKSEGAGVFVFTPTPEGAYSRMFAPDFGIPEDPATGGSTGPLAAYMMRHGLAPSAPGTRLISEQGTKMGRRSVLHIQIHGPQGAEGIEVGGYVAPITRAVMTLRNGTK